jgi:creatinine amidohydrolase
LVRKGWQGGDHEAPDRLDLLTLGMRGYTTNGLIGKPSLASPDKGAAILDSLVKSFADRLAVLRS